MIRVRYTFIFYRGVAALDTFAKLQILTDAAKYDAACTSSGVNRKAAPGGIGNATACGICHTFAGDGRCVSLLKVLYTNSCIYDCKYCTNRCSNDTPRAAFTPRELAELTISFYRRNYIEGLFLSSGVLRSPDYTCEQLIETLRILREEYRFAGYIHAKAIPGADNALLARLGALADRMSVNIELPSHQSLEKLAPDKSKRSILAPMGFISGHIKQNTQELVQYRHAPAFAPAGQSTQMIVGASPESDFEIITLSQALYKKYRLRRVFYSAYLPVGEQSTLPVPQGYKPPLLREHRLYQADWLLRFYGFTAQELLSGQNRNLSPYVDPKCGWALAHQERFPLEVNRAPYEELLRVPGVGVRSAQRIVTARYVSTLDWYDLKKLGVVLKRARYFLLCRGRAAEGLPRAEGDVLRALLSDNAYRSMERRGTPRMEQLSLFANDDAPALAPGREDVVQCLTGQL